MLKNAVAVLVVGFVLYLGAAAIVTSGRSLSAIRSQSGLTRGRLAVELGKALILPTALIVLLVCFNEEFQYIWDKYWAWIGGGICLWFAAVLAVPPDVLKKPMRRRTIRPSPAQSSPQQRQESDTPAQ